MRIAIEDLNKLVSIHIQRCVQRRAPNDIMQDVWELLVTGFSSLDHTLSVVPDEKLIPHLVQVWLLVFGTILPFIQVVFLPLDLEFKGCGPVMNIREAKDFWNGLNNEPKLPLDVRSMVLIAFRDTVVLSRYEALRATFSRLSLDILNSSAASSIMTKSSSGNNNSNNKPGTAVSSSLDSSYGSPNTLYNLAGSFSSDSISGNRSRATSNTTSSSNPDQQVIFHSFSSPSLPQQQQQYQQQYQHQSSNLVSISETVGRILQCANVLGSVQTDDKPQEQVEILGKALKQNWLGRARTGRDRRGFIGARLPPSVLLSSASGGAGGAGGESTGRRVGSRGLQNGGQNGGDGKEISVS